MAKTQYSPGELPASLQKASEEVKKAFGKKDKTSKKRLAVWVEAEEKLTTALSTATVTREEVEPWNALLKENSELISLSPKDTYPSLLNYFCILLNHFKTDIIDPNLPKLNSTPAAPSSNARVLVPETSESQEQRLARDVMDVVMSMVCTIIGRLKEMDENGGRSGQKLPKELHTEKWLKLLVDLAQQTQGGMLGRGETSDAICKLLQTLSWEDKSNGVTKLLSKDQVLGLAKLGDMIYDSKCGETSVALFRILHAILLLQDNEEARTQAREVCFGTRNLRRDWSGKIVRELNFQFRLMKQELNVSPDIYKRLVNIVALDSGGSGPTCHAVSAFSVDGEDVLDTTASQTRSKKGQVVLYVDQWRWRLKSFDSNHDEDDSICELSRIISIDKVSSTQNSDHTNFRVKFKGRDSGDPPLIFEITILNIDVDGFEKRIREVIAKNTGSSKTSQNPKVGREEPIHTTRRLTRSTSQADAPASQVKPSKHTPSQAKPSQTKASNKSSQSQQADSLLSVNSKSHVGDSQPNMDLDDGEGGPIEITSMSAKNKAIESLKAASSPKIASQSLPKVVPNSTLRSKNTYTKHKASPEKVVITIDSEEESDGGNEPVKEPKNRPGSKAGGGQRKSQAARAFEKEILGQDDEEENTREEEALELKPRRTTRSSINAKEAETKEANNKKSISSDTTTDGHTAELKRPAEATKPNNDVQNTSITEDSSLAGILLPEDDPKPKKGRRTTIASTKSSNIKASAKGTPQIVPKLGVAKKTAIKDDSPKLTWSENTPKDSLPKTTPLIKPKASYITPKVDDKLKRSSLEDEKKQKDSRAALEPAEKEHEAEEESLMPWDKHTKSKGVIARKMMMDNQEDREEGVIDELKGRVGGEDEDDDVFLSQLAKKVEAYSNAEGGKDGAEGVYQVDGYMNGIGGMFEMDAGISNEPKEQFQPQSQKFSERTTHPGKDNEAYDNFQEGLVVCGKDDDDDISDLDDDPANHFDEIHTLGSPISRKKKKEQKPKGFDINEHGTSLNGYDVKVNTHNPMNTSLIIDELVKNGNFTPKSAKKALRGGISKKIVEEEKEEESAGYPVRPVDISKENLITHVETCSDSLKTTSTQKVKTVVSETKTLKISEPPAIELAAGDASENTNSPVKSVERKPAIRKELEAKLNIAEKRRRSVGFADTDDKDDHYRSSKRHKSRSSSVQKEGKLHLTPEETFSKHFKLSLKQVTALLQERVIQKVEYGNIVANNAKRDMVKKGVELTSSYFDNGNEEKIRGLFDKAKSAEDNFSTLEKAFKDGLEKNKQDGKTTRDAIRALMKPTWIMPKVLFA